MSRPPTPACRCTSTRTPATASTMSLPSGTAKRAPSWLASGRWRCSAARMGEQVRLLGRDDNFEFGAYLARPSDARRGGLVLIQEIFGANAHIRGLADASAADGYETLAPSLYDRQEPGFEAGYDAAG